MATEEKKQEYSFDDFIEIGGEEGSMKPRNADGEVIKCSSPKTNISSVKDRRVVPRNRAGIELE